MQGLAAAPEQPSNLASERQQPSQTHIYGFPRHRQPLQTKGGLTQGACHTAAQMSCLESQHTHDHGSILIEGTCVRPVGALDPLIGIPIRELDNVASIENLDCLVEGVCHVRALAASVAATDVKRKHGKCATDHCQASESIGSGYGGRR